MAIYKITRINDAVSSKEQLVKEIARLLNMQETECMDVFKDAEVEDIEDFLQQLKLIVKKPLKEKWEKWSPKDSKVNDDYGWEIDSKNAEDAAYEFADEFGFEEAFESIVRALDNDRLADIMAYIFRTNDFESKYLK